MLTPLYRLADAVRHRSRQRLWHRDLATGRRGEDLAHRYLRSQGFVVVARNLKSSPSSPEVDIVAWEGEALVFVEVKTRHSDEYGAPDRAIDEFKRFQMFRAARDYVCRSGTEWSRVRFDVVGVVLEKPPRFSHFRDVCPTTTAA